MSEIESPFKLVGTRVVYDNGWIRVDEDSVIRPGGKEGIFGVVNMKEGSTVLPLTEDQDVFLAREYKYGIGKFSIEAMSGGLDVGEDPTDAAKRELMEELGFKAQQWDYLGYVDPFTTVVRSRNHMFLARGLEQGVAQDDPGEVIETIRLPLSEAVEMVLKAEITHSASCVLILKAHLHLRA
ncbi:NUDIX hydrolase [Actinomadura soli]|uniref:NUDIX hydrolase n=1 Tax=Actinomadura soli TaxID=2508997 RepID=A0A5C4J9C1_9ACTN|nr:NUDIX hydrolase [Actinomadura soli]TMQ96806.1 NUDIX hydrolase [Actinomadura soli]